MCILFVLKSIKKQLREEIRMHGFEDFWECSSYIYDKYDDDEQIIEVFESNYGFYNSLCKGKFLNNLRKKSGDIVK